MIHRQSDNNKSKLLKRLLRDQSGNAIIFIGASLIPMLALVGGGVDASRGYMAKARLQQACDAGTLAGRRAVADNGFDTNAELQANRLFNANFESDYLDSSNLSFDATTNDNGNSIQGVASVEIPTVIMRIFGKAGITISAACEAALSIANADVMMVLDTTGSMRYAINGRDLDVDRDGNARPGSRMFALREATKIFYNILENATAGSNARIRYGFVPYTSTVNVGRLLFNQRGSSLITGKNRGDTHTYPSRRAVYGVSLRREVVEEILHSTFKHVNGSHAYLTRSSCNRYANNLSFSYYTVRGSSFTRRNHRQENSGNPSNIGDVRRSFTFVSWRDGLRLSDGTLVQQCTRRTRTLTTLPRDEETYDGTTPGVRFLRYEHRNLEWPVDDYVASIDPRNPAARRPSEREDRPEFDRWLGCIEERNTTAAHPRSIRYVTNRGINPRQAFDLNIDRAPHNAATRWRPYWPEIVYNRRNFNNTEYVQSRSTNKGKLAFSNCPQPAQLFNELTRDEFHDYIDSLKPKGATYHDIGAIWGARLASSTGIFRENVNESPRNNGFVSRNLIFLTDGTLEPNNISYSAYGTEFQNPLVGPSRASKEVLRERHNARFLAVCEAIKAQNIRVFVIAFGTGLTNSLRRCASTDSAFVAADADSLNDRFLQIATNISDLRLTR